MKATIQVTRRVEDPPGRFTWVPEGSLTGDIVLEINEEKLAKLLGPRALRSKSKRSILAGGAIVARAVNLVRTEAT